MLAGGLYRATDPELTAQRQFAERLVVQYNASPIHDETRTTLLQQLLGSLGKGTIIRPPFACDYGFNIRLGINGFVNFNCVFLDCATIEIGDYVQVGPAVQFYTATHPLEADMRRDGLEYARPIRIGSDVWIGGGAIVLPGVTIGEGTVIGSGSVVVHDVLSSCVVVGNLARIVRRLEGSPSR